MFIVTEERTFLATHRIQFPDGSWEPFHEHLWLLRVSVRAKELDDFGLVIDFLDLQAAMQSAIQPYEGKVFNDEPPFSDGIHSTTEAIVWHFYRQMAPQIDNERVQLFRLELREAPTSWATYEVDGFGKMKR